MSKTKLNLRKQRDVIGDRAEAARAAVMEVVDEQTKGMSRATLIAFYETLTSTLEVERPRY